METHPNNSDLPVVENKHCMLQPACRKTKLHCTATTESFSNVVVTHGRMTDLDVLCSKIEG